MRMTHVVVKYSEQNWMAYNDFSVFPNVYMKAFLHFTAVARSLELLGNDSFLIILILVHSQFGQKT